MGIGRIAPIPIIEYYLGHNLALGPEKAKEIARTFWSTIQFANLEKGRILPEENRSSNDNDGEPDEDPKGGQNA